MKPGQTIWLFAFSIANPLPVVIEERDGDHGTSRRERFMLDPSPPPLSPAAFAAARAHIEGARAVTYRRKRD